MSSHISTLDTKRKGLEIEAKAITDELMQPTIDSENGKRTKPMGIDTPLVDEEGYPRSDIDIYRARDLRKRLNEIRYDHKSIMKEIENVILSSGSSGASTTSSSSSTPSSSKSNTKHSDASSLMDVSEMKARRAIKPKPKFDKASGKWVVCNWDGTVAGIENGHLRSFENLDSTNNDNDDIKMEDGGKMKNDSNSSIIASTSISTSSIENTFPSSCRIDGDQSVTTPQPTPVPFAKINEVTDYSPAADGGLKLHDQVVRIGSVNYKNHRDLQAVAEVVNRAFVDGTKLDFEVLRENSSQLHSNKTIIVRVKPGRWEGNGVLGCRIVKV
jgi:hypothetical protein